MYRSHTRVLSFVAGAICLFWSLNQIDAADQAADSPQRTVTSYKVKIINKTTVDLAVRIVSPIGYFAKDLRAGESYITKPYEYAHAGQKVVGVFDQFTEQVAAIGIVDIQGPTIITITLDKKITSEPLAGDSK